MADDPRDGSVASTPTGADSSVNDVVTPLHGLLPAGSAVALAWDDALLGSGCRTSPPNDARLGEAARALLAGDMDRPEFRRHSVAALRVAPLKLYR